MEVNFSIVASIVLPIAAILAFLVQRARYLREIEPDLELHWPETIRIAEISSTYNDFWGFYIDLEIENLSQNHSYDIDYHVDLTIFLKRNKPAIIQTRCSSIIRPYNTCLLASRKMVIPVYCGSNNAEDLQKKLKRYDQVFIKDSGIESTVTIKYTSQRELLLYTMLPFWDWGKKKYTRKITRYWGFRCQTNTGIPYSSANWQFPNEALEREPGAMIG